MKKVREGYKKTLAGEIPEDWWYEELNKLVEKKELDLLVAAFTSVSEDGSVFFAAGEQADKCFEAFPGIEDHLHVLQKGILSRKSQILPEITRVLNNS